MLPASAVSLINRLVFRPGWDIWAEPSDRFENAVTVRFTYPAQLANREEAPQYETSISANASFTYQVGSDDDIALYRKLLASIAEIDQHEAREFLRVRPTMWAPFHPHREDGMARWGNPKADLTFGIA